VASDTMSVVKIGTPVVPAIETSHPGRCREGREPQLQSWHEPVNVYYSRVVLSDETQDHEVGAPVLRHGNSR
jgi:hypothetical protein